MVCAEEDFAPRTVGRIDDARRLHAVHAALSRLRRACMTGLFPEELLTATDEVLDTFEGELPGLGEASDEKVFAVAEHVVLALNAVDEVHDGAAFETDEREELCDYVDQSLTEHALDVVALRARHGLGQYQLTDKWRKC